MTRTTLKNLLLALLFFPSVSLAGNVTINQAQDIAKAFMGSKGVALANIALPSRGAKQHNTTEKDYYVFNIADNGGFVIVSADDRTPQILGYSLTGSFDAASLPQNAKYLLDTYKEEIKLLDKENITEKWSAPATRATTRHAVQPFIKTSWGQSSPFNNKCPQWRGNTCATGCVATAMSQVMNYYQWPAHTAATIPSYTTLTNKIQVEGIAQGTAIDWNNMQNSYRSNGDDTGTTAQKNAVANLMLYTGTAVNMDYSPNASSSYIEQVPDALDKYFDYSSRLIRRASYTLSEFEDKIYNEVAAARPVIFGGSSTNGAHAFIIDGCDEDGLFHVNWGWYGSLDGYFRLSLLDTNISGNTTVSASDEGFSIYQKAIIGITKGKESIQIGPALMSYTDVTLANDSIKGSFYNLSGVTGTYETALVEVDGDSPTWLCQITQALSYPNKSGNYFELSLRSLSLSAGKHTLALASRQEGTSQWTYRDQDVVNVSVDGEGNVTAEFAIARGDVSKLSVKEWNFTGSKYAREKQRVYITIENSAGEYYGNVFLFAGRDGVKPTAFASRTGLTAQAEGETLIEMTFKPDRTGTYTVWLCSDNKGDNVIDSTTVQITASGTASFSLAMGNCDIKGTFEQEGKKCVYGTTLSGTLSIVNDGSLDFNNEVRISVIDKDHKSTGKVSNLGSVTIPADSTANFDFSFDGLETGYGYQIMFEYYNALAYRLLGFTNVYYLLPGGTSGVQAVRNNDGATTPFYNLSGQKVGKAYKGIVISNGRKYINR